MREFAFPTDSAFTLKKKKKKNKTKKKTKNKAFQMLASIYLLHIIEGEERGS
jgi:hypothetical protein